METPVSTASHAPHSSGEGRKTWLREVKAAYHQFLRWNWSDLICMQASLPGKSPTTGDNARKAAALRLVRCGDFL